MKARELVDLKRLWRDYCNVCADEDGNTDRWRLQLIERTRKTLNSFAGPGAGEPLPPLK